MEQTQMKMIEEFNTELRKTERPRIDELIDYMEEGGFYTAPCSGAHHLAQDSGLLEHSLNVLRIARQLNKALGEPIRDNQLIIISLLHDLGKMGDHGKVNYIENILKSGERSAAKPYITNTELAYIPHEVRSVMIAERFIVLSEQEEQAILFHNGLYSSFKYEIPGKETEMYLILHTADMYASRFVEGKNGTVEKN